MKISSKDVPQADNLADVLRVVQAVNNGDNTQQKIASAIGKVERQGRYYRLAAEILGFISNKSHENHSVLTASGKQFIKASEDEKKRILVRALLNGKLIQRVIPFLESFGSNGASRAQLQDFIKDVTEPVGISMIPRRISSLISWLREAHLIQETGSNIVLGKLPDAVDVIDYASDEEPLLPTRHDLTDYQGVADRIRGNAENYSTLVNQVAHERANQTHKTLTSLVAKRISTAGAIPRRNRFIDLAARMADKDYLFEMKSSNEDNLHSQVRKAVSQLYEYRYLQAIPTATLVLVIETQPIGKSKWLIDYLLRDRNIMIIWDGNGDDLFCPKSISKQMSFLNPIGI